MDELDLIADDLRRRRKNLDDMLEETASRSGEAAQLVSRIEDLRRRAEETQRRFAAAGLEAAAE